MATNTEQIRANLVLSDWDRLLFRCSELGHICTNGRGTQITDKQKEELEDLLTRIKLTPKQAERRDELIVKRDAPPALSQGAKSWLQQKWIEVVTGRKKYIETKFMEKGIHMETEGLKMANRVLGWGHTDEFLDALEFNKTRLSNTFITGEPDINEMALADIKCSWNLHTFPFFQEEDKVPDDMYFWQLQGYMQLCHRDESSLVYCLVDTPEHLILDEIRRREWKAGYIEMPDEDQDRIRMELTFQDIPEEMRVRRWRVTIDHEAQERIRQSVQMAREYLKELTVQMGSRYNLVIS
jgi:hypothetical protein